MINNCNKCIVCGRLSNMKGSVCNECAPESLFMQGRPGLKRALFIFLILILGALVVEGLWAAGVFSPHYQRRVRASSAPKFYQRCSDQPCHLTKAIMPAK